jgi:hypothetical protein
MPAHKSNLFEIGRQIRIRSGSYSGNVGRVIGWFDEELDVFLSGGPDWPIRINAAEAEPFEKSEARAAKLVRSDSRRGSD